MHVCVVAVIKRMESTFSFIPSVLYCFYSGLCGPYSVWFFVRFAGHLGKKKKKQKNKMKKRKERRNTKSMRADGLFIRARARCEFIRSLLVPCNIYTKYTKFYLIRSFLCGFCTHQRYTALAQSSVTHSLTKVSGARMHSTHGTHRPKVEEVGRRKTNDWIEPTMWMCAGLVTNAREWQRRRVTAAEWGERRLEEVTYFYLLGGCRFRC